MVLVAANAFVDFSLGRSVMEMGGWGLNHITDDLHRSPNRQR